LQSGPKKLDRCKPAPTGEAFVLGARVIVYLHREQALLPQLLSPTVVISNSCYLQQLFSPTVVISNGCHLQQLSPSTSVT
ncbi:hypothetical protein, partial [Pseudomonas mandelii]|uniref:hypothetical protein n=1 Tax=Pseudomonas mandelii TaxID=75612 RepID=UPI00224A6853